jgi:drug/metabolite transporter (DMT)-like permease
MVVDPLGATVLCLGSLSWAAGSFYTTRGARLPHSWILATGMQMALGGVMLLLIAALAGEYHQFHWSTTSLKSWVSLGYLTVFGAIVGYSAYVYLLRHTTPSHAATYAYVNPVIAVFLGWTFAGEPLNARVLLAAGTIVAGVALIITHRAPVAAAATGGKPTIEEPTLVR